MKKLKIIVICIVVVSSIFFIVYQIWEDAVFRNFSNKEKIISSKWERIFETSSIRLNYLRDLAEVNSDDSLMYFINKNVKKRHINKKANTLEFVKLEHDVNEQYLKGKVTTKTLEQLKENEIKLNSLIDEYNDLVIQFNKNISVFPNLIVARKNNIHKKVFFDVKYGENNEDPIEKSKSVPEWMIELEKQNSSL